MSTSKLIKVVQWDLGDTDEKGCCFSDQQWEKALQLLRTIDPDAVLLSGGMLALTGRIELELPGAVSVPAAEDREEPDRTSVGVAVNPRTFRVIDHARTRSRAWWVYPVHMQVELNAAPGAGTLNIVSFSMCRFDTSRRCSEARWLTELARDGAVTLAGGATRSYPRHSNRKAPLPDWSAGGDAVQRVHRTRSAGLHWCADTEPDTVLAGGDPAAYVDLAYYAARHCGLPDAVDPTVVSGAVRDDGQRVDRMYGSGGLASTVHSFILLPQTQTSSISPHRMIIVKLYRDRLAQLLAEQPSLTTPAFL